jgi:predicted PurR-regulated permease PerM
MVFVSVFVAVAMEPPVYFLAKRGWKRGPATGVVFLAAFLVVTVFIVSMVPLLIDQIGQLVEDIPSYVESVARLMEDWFGLGLTEDQLADQATTAQDWLTSNAGDVLGGVVGIGSSIFGFIFFAVTVGLFSFYMVAELPQLKRTVLSTMPEERQREALGIWDTAVEKMGGYIYSRLILAVIGGTFAVLFLTFLKVPFSVPLGIFVGFLSQFIPVVGTYLAAIFPAIVALSVSGATAIWVIVFFVLYQQVENFLISPRITKRTMSIHPAISIAAIIIGGAVMGAIGIILALPMAAIIQAVISTSIHRHEVVVSNDPEVASD